MYIIYNIHKIWYNRYMENKYRRVNNNVSFIKYNFVFCTRYKRKIFNIPGVKERTEELIKNECELLQINLCDIKCDINHVYLILEALPTISASEIMQKIKNNTSGKIREEFEELSKIPSLWTRKFFVSTEINNEEEIQKFIDEQKTR